MYYGYARVSTEQQHDTSIEVQLAFLKKQAELLGEEFTPKYEKQSGKNVEERTIFKSLLTILKSGDILGIYDNSRLSRAVVDSLRVADELDSRGVRIHCEGRFVDLSDPTQRMIFTVQSGFSEYQRGIQLKKSREGIDKKKANGDWVLRGDLFGWKTYKTRGKTIAEIDPTAAKYIKYIYEQYASGRSSLSISKELDSVVIPGWEHYRFTPSNVLRLLQKPIYMGYYTLNTQDWYRINKLTKAELKAMLIKSNIYEPIISEELYWAVFDSWRKIKRTHTKQYEYRWSAYELSSVFRCPICGRGWAHQYVKSRCTGNTTEYYINLNHRESCTSKLYRGFNKNGLEHVMRSSLCITFLSGGEVGQFFEDEKKRIGITQDEIQGQIDSVSVRYSQVTAKIANLVDAVADGIMDKDFVKEKMLSLKAEQDEYKRQLASLEKSLKYQDELFEELLEDASKDVIDNYAHAASTQKRDMLKRLLNHAHVYEDHLDIEFLNGKRFIVEVFKKNQKTPNDVKFEMSFRGEKQATGTISTKKGNVEFDLVDGDDSFVNAANTYYREVARKATERIDEIKKIVDGVAITSLPNS